MAITKSDGGAPHLCRRFRAGPASCRIRQLVPHTASSTHHPSLALRATRQLQSCAGALGSLRRTLCLVSQSHRSVHFLRPQRVVGARVVEPRKPSAQAGSWQTRVPVWHLPCQRSTQSLSGLDSTRHPLPGPICPLVCCLRRGFLVIHNEPRVRGQAFAKRVSLV